MSKEPPAVTRRGFLQAGSATPLLELTSVTAEPRKLSENLYMLEDTCNVYLLRDGDQGLLIDFGSGAILKHASVPGIRKIDWILHTHHHRDQAQGDYLAVRKGDPARRARTRTSLLRQRRGLLAKSATVRALPRAQRFFSLAESVPVAAELRDYDTFRWGKYEIFIQPAPGHTPGSVALCTEIDGAQVVFSGDLIHSPGKVQTLYDLQYAYGEHEGVDLSIYSLEALRARKPDMLCPSHGPPMRQPDRAIAQTIDGLTKWFRFWHASELTGHSAPVVVSPHLIAHPEATSTFYAIISQSGKAMLIDYGSASWRLFGAFLNATGPADRLRFVEHGLDRLRTEHGLKTIDVVVATHIHDDHLNGVPHLQRQYGAKFWCFENNVEILEEPRTRNTSCLLGEALRVDRALRNGETFSWEEFVFTAVHSPGHTEYQMALFTEIDGKRIGFTGDAFFEDTTGVHGLRHNLIFRNDTRIGDYAKSARNLLQFDPQIIAPGHGKPFASTRANAELFLERVQLQDELVKGLVADVAPDFGLDPEWIHLVPYQIGAMRGVATQVELRVRNHGTNSLALEVTLRLPDGWMSRPGSVKLTVAPRSVGKAKVSLTVPKGWKGRVKRVVILADVVVNGTYRGQVAEAVVNVGAIRLGTIVDPTRTRTRRS